MNNWLLTKISQSVVSCQLSVLNMLQVNIGDHLTLGDNQGGISGAEQFNSLGGFVSLLVPNVMVIANIVLFFLILFGGFKIITGAGNPDQQAQGAKTLTVALVGFIIIFGAYWILQLVGIISGYTFLENLTSGL